MLYFRLLLLSAACILLHSTPLISLNGQEQQFGKYIFQVLLVDDADYSRSKVAQPAVELKFASEGEMVVIQAYSHGLTSMFSYSGSPRFMFFKEVANTEGELIRQPLVQVNLGKSGRKILFIRKTSDGKYYTSVLEIDAEFFRENYLKIQNMSNQVVRAKVADSIETLESLGGHNFMIKTGDGPPMVELLMAAHDGEKAYVIEDKNYVFRRGNRKLILLYNDPTKGGRVRYSNINIVKAPRNVKNVSDEREKAEDVSGYYTGGGGQQEGGGPDGP